VGLALSTLSPSSGLVDNITNFPLVGTDAGTVLLPSGDPVYYPAVKCVFDGTNWWLRLSELGAQAHRRSIWGIHRSSFINRFIVRAYFTDVWWSRSGNLYCFRHWVIQTSINHLSNYE